MPISDKQLAANRRNAQFSTGPKSPEGKERSALNGFKHPELGLTALMVDEDREAQTAFIREYIVDLDPRGAVEIQLARTLAMDNWRLNRIKAVEENIFAWGYAVEHKDCCSSEIPEVENAMIHAVSYMQWLRSGRFPEPVRPCPPNRRFGARCPRPGRLKRPPNHEKPRQM